MKAMVDQEICIGCQICANTCPDVFNMEGDKAVAFVDLVPVEYEDTCQQAADECPVDAITIKE